MTDNKFDEKAEDNENMPPKSPKSRNTYRDFFKICRAYYDELMHLSKNKEPSLSKKDIIILSDVIDEIVTYSNELIDLNFIKQAQQLLEYGLLNTDFLLKIFEKMVEEYQTKAKKENNKENLNIVNHTLSEKMRYPLSLKLRLMKLNFKILIKNDKDYTNAEKNLKEIIEIQTYLKASNYNLASSKFWLAKIEYFLEHYNEAETLALEAKDLYENSQKKKKEENNNINNIENDKENQNNIDLENNIAQNVSNIFRFLAQIYLLKGDYKNAATFYEHGYYLNLGRFGAENADTIYFKTKLDAINEEFNKYPSFQSFKPKNNNDMGSTRNNINNNNNVNNNYEKIMHKGQAETFSFKIPSSSLLEPFLLTLYRIGHNPNVDRYSAELLFGNVLLDKQKLSKYLRLKGNNINNLFYTDENLNIILGNMKISNEYLVFLDKNLKDCLINSSCLVKKK